MDDEAQPDAEEVWEAAAELLDADELDASALPVLERAARALTSLNDDESRERFARVLEGIVFCRAEPGETPACMAIVEDLLEREWPEEALWYRLNAALTVLRRQLLPYPEADALADRALSLAEGSDDDACRALAAELLKYRAYGMMSRDAALARALLERARDEYADVDDPLDSAEDRLGDPYFHGWELMNQPGRLADAEAAFRQAVEDGEHQTWLELAAVLGYQAGREDEEEQAWREALEAQEVPERLALAGLMLGRLLLYGKGDLAGAREALGRATTGRGEDAAGAVQELAVIAVLEGDHLARRQLIAEFAGRQLEEFDETARRKDHRGLVLASRLGYAKPFIRVRAWRWRRGRRRQQRRYATGSTR